MSVLNSVRLVSTYGTLLAVIAVFAISAVDSNVFNGVPQEALLAAMGLAFIGVAAHLDTRLLEVSRELRELATTQEAFVQATVPVVSNGSLSHGFALLKSRVSRVGTLRVFAASSKDIFTFTSFHGFTIDHLHLLIRGFDPVNQAQSEAAVHVRQMVREWQSLQKTPRLNEMVLRSYDFLPTEFQIIADDEFMITGLYASDPTDYREVRVLEAAFVDGTTDAGREMIRRYIERFDSLFDTCEHHHGDDVYN